MAITDLKAVKGALGNLEKKIPEEEEIRLGREISKSGYGEAIKGRQRLADQFSKQASQFREQAPQRTARAQSLQSDLARRELAQGLQGARRSSNRRGLLFSGLGRQAEQDVQNEIANALAQRQAAIAAAERSQLEALDQQELENALGLQQLKLAKQSADYGDEYGAQMDALSRQLAGIEMAQGIGSAVGQLGGGLLKRKMSKAPTTEDMGEV